MALYNNSEYQAEAFKHSDQIGQLGTIVVKQSWTRQAALLGRSSAGVKEAPTDEGRFTAWDL